MSEKPILFNTEMVRAILAGKKTQTRRPIKVPVQWSPRMLDKLRGEVIFNDGGGQKVGAHHIARLGFAVGDTLWVRETWAPSTESGKYLYKATVSADWIKWHPSIHMPREAARLFLRVTDVRVERVQDISETDTFREGMINVSPIKYKGHEYRGAKPKFMLTWDFCYSKRGLGWDANPWVWVISFEVEK
jgi:hypothetical protein